MTIEETIQKYKNRVEQYKNLDNMEEFVQEYKQLAEWLEELQTLKEKENKGLILCLPCPLKSDVWKIVNQRDNFSDIPYKIVTRVPFCLDMMNEIGKTVFLQYKEAEEALNNMRDREEMER